MLWGRRWEGGSCLGTHVRIKDFKIKHKVLSKLWTLLLFVFERHLSISLNSVYLWLVFLREKSFKSLYGKPAVELGTQFVEF